MRVLAIGDVHGCLDALETLADYVGFGSDDQLIMLGDYVDRGPDSKEVVDWVIERTLDGNCIPLLGNHEIMLLDALGGRMPLEHWLSCGGRETLLSYTYPGRTPHPSNVPEAHRWFLQRELKRYHETELHLFAHASIDSEYPLDQQPEHTLFWERCDGMAPHYTGKTAIVGHTAQRSGRPLNMPHFVCIDTWVYGDGWLTCLDPASGQYWQANQRRQTRTDWLTAPGSPPTDQPWDYP
ncbi:MAG: serine/threonine protein phosphatase [Planctomycetaceae bacterium]|nr:serine/threonine protein phosphatase [Planctomycetaceae bacterium]